MPMFRQVVASVALSLCVAAPVRAQTADTAGVMGTLNRFLAALKIKDTTAMLAELDPAMRVTLLRPAAEGGVRVMAMDGPAFVRLAASPTGPFLDEPIRNPKLHIDADLASVWAEYQVRINGAVSHCGFDAFHLVRKAGSWKLLTVADTFRREGCGAMWP